MSPGFSFFGLMVTGSVSIASSGIVCYVPGTWMKNSKDTGVLGLC